MSAAVLLDTHVLHWVSSEPDRLSVAAATLIREAEELCVSGVTWFELAALARRERIVVSIPVRTWLEGLASDVRTIGITPAVADTAASLGSGFPGDPADRLIYATAVEHALPLISKDGRMRGHPGSVAVW